MQGILTQACCHAACHDHAYLAHICSTRLFAAAMYWYGEKQLPCRICPMARKGHWAWLLPGRRLLVFCHKRMTHLTGRGIGL